MASVTTTRIASFSLALIMSAVSVAAMARVAGRCSVHLRAKVVAVFP